jgi:hypothetical protein
VRRKRKQVSNKNSSITFNMNNKKIIGLLLLAIVAVSAQAQDSYIKGRWNAKLGYSNSFKMDFSDTWRITNPMLQVEANYGLTDWLYVGVDLGYSPTAFSSDENSKSLVKGNAQTYGIHTELHVLPLLIKDKRLRVDFYLKGKVGGYRLASAYIFDPVDLVNTGFDFGEMKLNSRSGFDYGASAGLAFYVTQHLGIYGEYGLGDTGIYDKYAFKERTVLRYGLTWKW